jgi:Domain of unknown function (DUF4112)
LVKNPFKRKRTSVEAPITGATLSSAQRLTLRGAQHIAPLFDTRFRVLGVRFGLDPLVGMIPGVGDIVTAGVAVYMLLVALHLGLPMTKLLQIAALVGTDVLVGLVPLAGDAADFVLKANARSLRIIEDHVRGLESTLEARA